MDQIDTVLAFASIMLLLSLLITATVQLVVAVLGLRGRNLLWALRKLFEQLLPDVATAERPKVAKAISAEVLGHGVWATSTNYLTWTLNWLAKRFLGRPLTLLDGKRAPTRVRKEEVRLVLDSLVANGTLQSVFAKRFPRDEKELAQLLARGTAVTAMEKRFDDWFDLVMDAASEKFKLWSRWVTVIGALLLAFGMQVDSIDLFRQLSNDPALRAEVLARVPEAQTLFENVERVASTPAPSDVSKDDQVEALKAQVKSIEAELTRTGIVVLRPWRGGLPTVQAFWGMVATTLLLSLGAPFWYGVLQNVLRFRSSTTQKQEATTS